MTRKSPKPLDPRFEAQPFGPSRKLNSSVGNLYTFFYRSKSATDPSPLVLNVRRNNQRVFMAKNRKSYMGGINLNHVSDTIKALLLRKFYSKGIITWKDVVISNKFGNVPYRIYNVSKMRNLRIVSADIYLREIDRLT